MLIFRSTVAVVTGLLTFLIGCAIAPDIGAERLDLEGERASRMLNEREAELQTLQDFEKSLIEGIENYKPTYKRSNKAPSGYYTVSQGGDSFEELHTMTISTFGFEEGSGVHKPLQPYGKLRTADKEFDLLNIWGSQQFLSFKTVKKNGIQYKFAGKVAVRLSEYENSEYDEGDLTVTGTLQKFEYGSLVKEAIVEFEEEVGC